MIEHVNGGVFADAKGQQWNAVVSIDKRKLAALVSKAYRSRTHKTQVGYGAVIVTVNAVPQT